MAKQLKKLTRNVKNVLVKKKYNPNDWRIVTKSTASAVLQKMNGDEKLVVNLFTNEIKKL